MSGGKLTAAAAAMALLLAGVYGAYAYGSDYSVHRGFTQLTNLPRAGTGQLREVHFYSQALGREADYLVYLPPHYQPGRRYPVYYLLHGTPGKPAVFVDIANMDVRLDNQLSLGHVRPMILVYPDGRIGDGTTSDSEWANTPSGQFESYVIEVVHQVDQHFGGIPNRRDRVIGGYSEGGFGAINIGLQHLSQFANIQVWSGYYRETRTGVFARASRATLTADSPIDYVRRLRAAIAREPLHVYMFIGRDDGDARQQIPMARALHSEGAVVHDAFYPGGHDWAVWYPRLNQMLKMASADIAHPLDARTAARQSETGAAPLTTPPPHTVAPTPRRPLLALLGALALALVSAALINLGFVLPHRGHARVADRDNGLRAAFTDRIWLLGQAIGWVGFAGSVVALALAPLTQVQAFAAGSLALSVPVAARMLGMPVTRRQLLAVALIGAALIALPIGGGLQHQGTLRPGIVLGASLALGIAAIVTARFGAATARALAAGVLYGIADAAIKADSIALRAHGLAGLWSGWTVLAALATWAGFLCFQSALRGRDPVMPLTLMTAMTAITAVIAGIAGFGEQLGTTTASTAAHAVAIVVVLACIRPLAAAQTAMSGGVAVGPATDGAADGNRPHVGASARRRRAGRALPHLGALAAGLVATALACVAGVGLLYLVRQQHWFAVGPPVGDALPLLQLAGFASQPLMRVVIAWLAAGAALGMLLCWTPATRRLVLVAVVALSTLLLASDASRALSHNLPIGRTLVDAAPGLGPWAEMLLLVAGAAIVDAVDASPLRELRLRTRPVRHSTPAGSGAQAASASATRPSGWGLRGPRRRTWTIAITGLAGAALATPLLLAACATVAGSGAGIRQHRIVSDIYQPRVASDGQLSPALEARVNRETGGRLTTIHFYSAALRKRADYLIYLPARYHRTRRYPVFYMLHGMPGEPFAFTVNANIEVRLQRLIAARRIRPMILVFPDGRIDGRTQSDSEWANTPSGNFESYVLDVVHNVDARFSTLPHRGERALAGLSAGAYGAANVGLHHISTFGLIQVWSGYFIETHNGVFAHANRATMFDNSPLDYVPRMRPALRRWPLRIFIFAGRDDPYHTQVPAMAAALKAAGAHEAAAIYAGGHSWNVWTAHTDQMLVMASRDFAHPLGSQPSRRSTARDGARTRRRRLKV